MENKTLEQLTTVELRSEILIRKDQIEVISREVNILYTQLEKKIKEEQTLKETPKEETGKKSK